MLLFIIIVILCIICLKSDVFATDYTWSDFPEVTSSIKGNHIYAIIRQDNNDRLVVFTGSDITTSTLYRVYYSPWSSYYLVLNNNSDRNNVDGTACTYYKIQNGVWVYDFNYPNCHIRENSELVYCCSNDIYNSDLSLYFQKTSTFVNPSFINPSDISTFNFNYLQINGGSEDFYTNSSNISRQRIFDLELDYQGYTYTMNINDYAILGQDGSCSFAIPKYALFPQLIFRNGEQLDFSLIVTPSAMPNSTGNWSSYGLGTYTLSLTTSEEEQLIEDRQAQQMDNIESGINSVNSNISNLNNNINNLNSDITDSNVDNDITSDFSDLSSGFEIEDVSGLEQVFQKLYNAFCTDSIVNVSFTIPFVNKPVTISSDNISSHYPTAVKSIVGVFVWGIIGLWVLKDVRSSVNKIAEGRAEDVGSDVKKEVL